MFKEVLVPFTETERSERALVIATDLTRHYEQSRGQTVEEMGAKTPRDGAASTLFLLFGDPQGTGHYYGSDAKRSPLDHYRAPGTPPYTGDSRMS